MDSRLTATGIRLRKSSYEKHISSYESVVIMTDEKLARLFEAFAHHYWSIPVAYVTNKIAEWHPDLTVKQVDRVLNKCNDNLFWHHVCVVDEVVPEPELVTEHLVAVDENDFFSFVAARIDAPFRECAENELLNDEAIRMQTPEARAVIDFAKTQLGLDEEWGKELVSDCILSQPCALVDKTSWVMDVLQQHRFGRQLFSTVEQVKIYRDLGNRFYQVLPNPVLRGWKPEELSNSPVLLDDIPEKDSDIPNERALVDKILDPYGGREKVSQMLQQRMSEKNAKRRKIGRNEPCPCGSGLKFKKCTCAQYHPVW